MAAISMGVVAILVAVIFLGGYAYAFRSAGMAAPRPSVVAVVMTLWMLTTGALAASGALSNFEARPRYIVSTSRPRLVAPRWFGMPSLSHVTETAVTTLATDNDKAFTQVEARRRSTLVHDASESGSDEFVTRVGDQAQSHGEKECLAKRRLTQRAQRLAKTFGL